jgi:hypothetical protein
MAGWKKMPMVAWFDPRQLIDTAIRVVLSTVFGQFADRREAFAAANPIADDRLDSCFDYEARHADGDFWFDYVADVGDGWNPTYAVARLLARDGITLGEGDDELKLPRGTLLIMGGDEVYPTAKPAEYENRLIYPYEAAHLAEGGKEGETRGDLFAMPGNHDWYDGLRTFFHYFCRRTVKAPGEAGVDRKGRAIGGRQTHQTRSYFALRLPHGWWLWGTDSQLEGFIDQPQVDFFQFVAQQWMEKGSKLILCTGTPDWEYVKRKGPESFSSHSYLERLATDVAKRGHHLKLVLSGDSHHYVRYREGDRNYITCGGGGAFMHPTHKLEDQIFESEFPPPEQDFDRSHGPYQRRFEIADKVGSKGQERAPQEEAIYPDRAVSARLARGNILFALTNRQLTATLAGLYFFFILLLDFNARLSGQSSLIAALQAGDSFADALRAYGLLVLYSPWTILLCLVSVLAYHYFANAKGLARWAIGIVHALLQAAVVTLVVTALLYWLGSATCGWLGILGWEALAALAGAFASATIVGLYLWAALSWCGIHWGHFSSLRVQDHKSFLRLHIDGEGVLSVYPIGLDRTPRDDGAPVPHLIEGPIKIPPPSPSPPKEPQP